MTLLRSSRVWLRAHDVAHLVVLRAHLLRPALLAALAELAAADRLIVWLVWHHPDPPPPGSANGVWPSWRCAVATIRGHRPCVTTLVLERDELAYRDVLARARREARLWRIDPPRQRRFTEPACALGAVLQALGKRRGALARERRVRDGAELVRVWLRAHDVAHLVVLRAHLLRPALLAALAELAAADGLIVWLVWHHHPDPPPPGSANGVWPSWRCAVATIRGHRPCVTTLVLERDELAYRDVLARARREARLWRIDPPRQRRFTEPACALGAVLQGSRSSPYSRRPRPR